MENRRDADLISIRLTIVMTFLLLILPAIAGRLTSWRWQPWPVRRSECPSAFRAARDQASTLAQLSLVGL